MRPSTMLRRPWIIALPTFALHLFNQDEQIFLALLLAVPVVFYSAFRKLWFDGSWRRVAMYSIHAALLAATFSFMAITPTRLTHSHSNIDFEFRWHWAVLLISLTPVLLAHLSIALGEKQPSTLDWFLAGILLSGPLWLAFEFDIGELWLPATLSIVALLYLRNFWMLAWRVFALFVFIAIGSTFVSALVVSAIGATTDEFFAVYDVWMKLGVVFLCWAYTHQPKKLTEFDGR